MPDYINRVRHYLAYGMDLAGIRDVLLANGLTEYQIFLTVKAAELLDRDSQSAKDL